MKIEKVLEEISRMDYFDLDEVESAINARRVWLERRDDWSRAETEDYYRSMEEYESPQF